MERRDMEWQRYPSAEEYLGRILTDVQEKNPFIRKLGLRLKAHAGARLFDWIDYLITPEHTALPLNEVPFCMEKEAEGYRVFHVPESVLPRLVIGRYAGIESGAAVRVERIADFQAAHQCPAPIEGTPFSGFRRSLVNQTGGIGVFAVERRVA
ncbi:hypothetical protein JXA80_08365, partial [bacterium]|nr:hypothetical protein [candidate division CSSED10-310 bacterium]